MVGTCFSDYAIKVSQSCCLSSNKTTSLPLNPIPSIQNAVISLYRTNLISTQNQLLIRITWYKSFKVPGSIHSFDISDDNLNSPQATKISIDSRCFRKIIGERKFEFCGSKIEIFWDLSLAKYDTGPEPISDFYLAVKVDSELGLFLGEMREEITGSKRFSFTLVSRTEHLYGNVQYSTKAQFCENGSAHDILIRCSGNNGEEGSSSINGPDPELSVCINDKQVIREERLQWNFRGNRIIYVDGLLVDLMWDVFDWFFNPVSECGAVFLFRTRSGLQSRLWLEEKMWQKSEERVGFSLLIYASKSIVKKKCSRFID